MRLDASQHDVDGIDGLFPDVAAGAFFEHDHELVEGVFKQFFCESVEFPVKNTFLDLFRDELVNVSQMIVAFRGFKYSLSRFVMNRIRTSSDCREKALKSSIESTICCLVSPIICRVIWLSRRAAAF